MTFKQRPERGEREPRGQYPDLNCNLNLGFQLLTLFNAAIFLQKRKLPTFWKAAGEAVPYSQHARHIRKVVQKILNSTQSTIPGPSVSPATHLGTSKRCQVVILNDRTSSTIPNSKITYSYNQRMLDLFIVVLKGACPGSLWFLAYISHFILLRYFTVTRQKMNCNKKHLLSSSKGRKGTMCGPQAQGIFFM